MKQKKYFKKLAAVLMVAVAVQTIGCAEASGAGNKNIAGAIVMAKYPVMAQYPKTDGWEYDEEEYEAWRDSRKAQEPESTDYQEGIQEFCMETMSEFLGDAKGENRIYSPLNVYMALAMLAEITEGNSREQILTLLHTETIDELREKAKTLWNANYCDDGTVTSLLAASVWMNKNVNYNKETLERLSENYYASSFLGEMGSEKYNQSLQDWLNDQTGGLLEEQASQIIMNPLDVLVLATTVHYQAKWANEFNVSNTEEGIFYTETGEVNCDFMKQTRSNMYFWGEKFSAVSRGLQYSGEMLLILPDEGVAVEDLLTDEETLEFIFGYPKWENGKYLIVNQFIPKFDVVSDIDLKEGLQKLGVTDAFDPELSDYQPLTTDVPVCLSQAKHAARVMIDEEGCTAAAYTVMAATGSAMPPKEEVDFILNRPFLFVLNGQDGQPLFIGIVNQP